MTKDKKPFFSIIIPIYKTEEFLEECLESVKNQTFSDYECIVINDGSPGIPISSKKSPLYKIDSSKQVKKIFDSVTKKDKRFKLYQKKNEGLSATKNFGIAKASGQRLVILDSDDYLNKSYLHNAYSFIIKNNHNNIFYGNVKILEGKKVNSFASSQKFLPTKNSLKTILTFPTWTVTPVSYFWRLDIIQKHQITNRVGKKGEDTAFALDCLLAYDNEFGQLNFNFISDSYYFYRQFPNQMSKHENWEIELFNDTTEHMNSILPQLKKVGLSYYILGQLFILRFKTYRKKLLSKSVISRTIYGIFGKFLTLFSIAISGAKKMK